MLLLWRLSLSFTSGNTSGSGFSNISVERRCIFTLKPGVGPMEAENLTISGLDTFGVGTNDPLYTEAVQP